MSGRIPKEFVDELLLRVDIVEVIDARVPLKKAGKDYKACCPFHDEKTPSFTVSPAKQFYYCFGCHASGTAISFLMEYEHMSFPEAIEDLAGRIGLPIPKDAVREKSEASANLYSVLEEAARLYRAQLRESPTAIAYLKGRGISGEVAAAFGIGYAPEGWDYMVRHLGTSPSQLEALVQAGLAIGKEGGGGYDRFRDRVMFPIHDYRGRIVGFGGRVIGKGEPKYLNSPETPLFHKGRELYGLYRARDAIRRAGRVVVVEGYMDVVGLAQFGVNNAVATLGTATTRDHLERLFRFAPDVTFCFDGDRAGREAAWKAMDIALPLLLEGRHASFLFLPETEDPDTLVRKEGGEAFSTRLLNALPVAEYLFQELSKQVDFGKSDARVRLAELARPFLSNVPAGVLREAMLDRLKLSPEANARLSELEKSSVDSFRPNPAQQGRRPPSLTRLAIALLIQHPELGRQVADTRLLAELDLPGMDLFQKVVRIIEQQPQLNTAALVEQFRGTEHEMPVARLAAWDHPSLAQDVRAEFMGVMAQMRVAAIKAGTERLLQKQRIHGLTPNEKVQLTRLLTEKQEAVLPRTH